MNKNCISCGKVIEIERLEILPDTEFCISCAKIINPKRKKGAMIFDHKTAPTICIMTAEHYDNIWKRYNPTFGRGSGVHKMSPPVACVEQSYD